MAEAPLTDQELRDIRTLLSVRRVDPALKAQRDAADAALVARQDKLRADVDALPESVAVVSAKDDASRQAAADALYKSQAYLDLVAAGDAEVAQLIDARKALG